MEYKKQNKTSITQTLINSENILTVDSWKEGDLGGWVKTVKGLRGTNWKLQNSHGDVRYSIGNIVNNIVIATYGIRWALDLLG